MWENYLHQSKQISSFPWVLQKKIPKAGQNSVIPLFWHFYKVFPCLQMQDVFEIPMTDTIPRNFDINLNINITNIKNRYQSQYQYCRNQNLISIPIPIPRIMKFKLNLKTIPRYLDILRSHANTQKNSSKYRASMP